MHTRIPFDLYTAEGVADYRAVHGTRRRPGREARRVTVRRARRRPVPRRAAGPHVRPGTGPGVRRAQGHLRPRRQDEPGQGGPPGPAGRAPAPRAPTGLRTPRRTCSSGTPTTAGRSPRPPTGAWASASAASTPTRGAVMCPSYQVTRRRNIPPGAGPGCCSRCCTATTTHRSPTAGGPPRSATRSTSAWPARAARPTARPTWTWPRTRPSSWPITGRTAVAAAPVRSHARLAARPGRGGGPAAAGPRGQHAQPRPRAAPGRRACRGRRAAGGAAVRGREPAALVRPPRPARTGQRGTVLLWPDTFTNYFHPHAGQAAVAVLEDAGWRVEIPAGPLCCGLTWISTGQLGTAKRVLRRTVTELAEQCGPGATWSGWSPAAPRCSGPTRRNFPGRPGCAAAA